MKVALTRPPSTHRSSFPSKNAMSYLAPRRQLGRLAIVTAALGATALAGTPSAQSSVSVIEVTLDAAQEVPPGPSPGTATATVTVDTNTGLVSVNGSYSGLIGNATVTHLHGPAAVGSNGPVMVNLQVTGGTSGTIGGSGIFSPSMIQTVLSGLSYINVHTTAIAAGEVRGQVVAVPAASAYGSGVNPAKSLVVLSGSPKINSTFTVGVDNPLGTQSAGATCFLFIALDPDPLFVAIGSGIPLPGLGMAGPVGELLISIAPPNPVFNTVGSPWAGPGSPFPFPLPLPNNVNLAGKTIYLQGMMFDGATLGLTEGMSAYLGI